MHLFRERTLRATSRVREGDDVQEMLQWSQGTRMLRVRRR